MCDFLDSQICRGNEGDTHYDENTIHSRNPIVRYAHKNRVRRSIALTKNLLRGGRLLDYGCGTGHFVSQMNLWTQSAVGYEPFMVRGAVFGVKIFNDFSNVLSEGPFDLVTLFEVIEHLSDSELDEFLERSNAILSSNGVILFSAPIEIGPALAIKELNRLLLQKATSRLSAFDFLLACFLGIAGRRAEDIKTSHKGYDFRKSLKELRRRGYEVEVICYGPLPIRTWYGNSQVYFVARRR